MTNKLEQIQKQIAELKANRYPVLKKIHTELLDILERWIDELHESLPQRLDDDMPKYISDLDPAHMMDDITLITPNDLETEQEELEEKYGYSYKQLEADIEELEAQLEE